MIPFNNPLIPFNSIHHSIFIFNYSFIPFIIQSFFYIVIFIHSIALIHSLIQFNPSSNSIQFHSIPFHSIPFIPFNDSIDDSIQSIIESYHTINSIRIDSIHSIQSFHSIPFHSIPFNNDSIQ